MPYKNKEKQRANRKIYHEINKQKIKEYKRAYYQANKVTKQESRNEQNKIWYDNNQEEINKRRRAYYHANIEKARNQSYKKRYGLTFNEVKIMKEKQEDKCSICKKVKFLCVDHCHDTGRVRGMLCKACNLAIGYFQDNSEICLNAAEYLKNSVKQQETQTIGGKL